MEIELQVHINEASDLLEVTCDKLLSKQGWDMAFWTVLDEGPVDECLALLSHQADEDLTKGWEAHHVSTFAGDESGRTEDGEALAAHDGYVYVVGSHYGKKGGPLKVKRSFLARFKETSTTLSKDLHTELEVSRNGFRLHRALNDALQETDLDLLGVSEDLTEAFIHATRKLSKGKGKKWHKKLKPGDYPVNIEGAAFTPEGTLLLGLRYPVTTQGQPLLVEVLNVEDMFRDRKCTPKIGRIMAVEGLGSPDELVGFRAMQRVGDEYHAITGSLDAVNKGSLLIEAHPEGAHGESTHSIIRLKDTGASATVARRFEGTRNVEGLARTEHRTFYVLDEDHRIAIRVIDEKDTKKKATPKKRTTTKKPTPRKPAAQKTAGKASTTRKPAAKTAAAASTQKTTRKPANTGTRTTAAKKTSTSRARKAS